MLKVGLNFPNGGAWGDPRTLSELARLAEDSGWDGVFLEDYIVWQGDQATPSYDPWTCLAAIALATRRVRLGTTVTPLARRRPWVVAKQAVSLDHLSNGRMVLGVGLGDVVSQDVSFSHFGEQANPRRRAAMLDEALQIVAGLWSGAPFSFAGEFYQVQEITLLPRPLQSPRIPIWVGGGFPLKGPLQRAAHWDGACLYRHKTHYLSADDVRQIRATAHSAQPVRSAYDIVVGGSPRQEDEQAERAYIRSLAEAGMTWWLEYLPPDTGDLAAVKAAIARGPLTITDD